MERELTALLYEGEILGFRRCEEARKDLVKRHDFSTYACFRAVDERNEGEINLDNLRAFLKRAGHYPTEEQVVSVIRRLDLDADSCVSYAEFAEGIKPQEFSLTNQYLLPQQPHKSSTFVEEKKLSSEILKPYMAKSYPVR